MVGTTGLEELEAKRDEYLIALNKLLWDGKSGVY